MKVSELRIGNWYKGDCLAQQYWQITAQEILDFYDDPIDDYFQPIELTEDWFLKFGFDKTYNDFNWYIKGNYCFSFLKELDLIVFKIKFQTVDICTIKYVHQLQNLYFALTQEEL